VIAHQAIAVYANPGDTIVIRQDGDWYRKEDPWIVVRRENARAPWPKRSWRSPSLSWHQYRWRPRRR
jgi:hypothetical protein